MCGLLIVMMSTIAISFVTGVFYPCLTAKETHRTRPTATLKIGIQLPLVHSRGLRSHLHRFGKTDSLMCNNCSTEETVSHFVLQCPVYEQERSQLKLKARELGIQFELCTILWDPRLMRYAIEFVLLTGRTL